MHHDIVYQLLKNNLIIKIYETTISSKSKNRMEIGGNNAQNSHAKVNLNRNQNKYQEPFRDQDQKIQSRFGMKRRFRKKLNS